MDVLGQVAAKSDSAILLFFIIIAVVALILALPLYKAAVKAAETKRKQEFETTDKILDVIKQNSTVITGLTVVLENNKQSCVECQKVQMLHFIKIEDLIMSLNGGMFNGDTNNNRTTKPTKTINKVRPSKSDIPSDPSCGI
jgi:hypothetical protein